MPAVDIANKVRVCVSVLCFVGSLIFEKTYFHKIFRQQRRRSWGAGGGGSLKILGGGANISFMPPPPNNFARA